MKVLYFEDEKVLNKLMTLRLEKEGFDVVKFFKCQDAIEWIQNGNIPELALLDIVQETPEYVRDAGFQIATELKNLNQDLPIIFLTAFGEDDEIKEQAEKFAPFEFFDKGKNSQEVEDSVKKKVLNKIKRVLGKKMLFLDWEEKFSNARFNKVSLTGYIVRRIYDDNGKLDIKREEEPNMVMVNPIEDIIYAEYFDGEIEGKSKQYLEIILNNRFQKIIVNNLLAKKFYEQINVYCELKKIQNPFFFLRRGIYFNGNFVEAIKDDRVYFSKIHIEKNKVLIRRESYEKISGNSFAEVIKFYPSIDKSKTKS